jgi:hypothetical protein
VILEDTNGNRFWTTQAASSTFDLNHAPLAEHASRATVGVFDPIARGWAKQIFQDGCWLATMAVLAGKTQKEIQESLKWQDSAFYGMVDQSGRDLMPDSPPRECAPADRTS